MTATYSAPIDVPSFSEAYQDARRAYGLASAFLIALELIGIDFKDNPIEGINITLKSPQAVPYILIVLVVYFSFRFTVEWYQNHPGRRAMVASRTDFAVAHLIGISALGLYGLQTLLEIQVANEVQPTKFFVTMVGVAVGQMVHAFLGQRRRFREKRVGVAVRVAIVLLLILGIWLTIHWASSLLGYAVLGSVIALALQESLDSWGKRHSSRSAQGNRPSQDRPVEKNGKGSTADAVETG